jgi:hypothetical protein
MTMTVDEFHRLLIAPEIIVLDVADAVLLALQRALVLEHPLVESPASHDDPLVRRRARHVLRSVARLLRALRAYRGAVLTVFRETQLVDDPF